MSDVMVIGAGDTSEKTARALLLAMLLAPCAAPAQNEPTPFPPGPLALQRAATSPQRNTAQQNPTPRNSFYADLQNEPI